MARPGRKRKQGHRFPSGKLIEADPSDDHKPWGYWRRFMDHVRPMLKDERLASVLGRLWMFKVIGQGEFMAGIKYAEITGRYFRSAGFAKTTAKSPAFERGFGSSELALERLDENQQKEFHERAEKAKEAYWRARKMMAPQAVKFVEAVCCDDVEISSEFHRDLSLVLSRLAISWGYVKP